MSEKASRRQWPGPRSEREKGTSRRRSDEQRGSSRTAGGVREGEEQRQQIKARPALLGEQQLSEYRRERQRRR